MTLSLSKLQKLAEKAKDFTIELDQFKDAIEPEDVLALIRVARFAKVLLELVEEDGRLTELEIQPIRDALKEIEP